MPIDIFSVNDHLNCLEVLCRIWARKPIRVAYLL